MEQGPVKLEYARPSTPEPRHPLVAWVLFGTGTVGWILTLGVAIADDWDSVGATVFGTLLAGVFLLGAVVSALYHYRGRRPRAGLLILLNLAGIVLSLVVSCAGVPKR